MMEWHKWDQSLWHNQPQPPMRKNLLVQIAPKPLKGFPAAVAVGYCRLAAGCTDSPTFVIPGVGGTVTAWCDCLPDDFAPECWPGMHRV